jgi:hypothetical protein
MKIFSHHHYIQTGSIRLLANGTNGGFSTQIKQLQHEADHSSPHNAEVNASSLPLLDHLHVLGTELWDRDNFAPSTHQPSNTDIKEMLFKIIGRFTNPFHVLLYKNIPCLP